MHNKHKHSAGHNQHVMAKVAEMVTEELRGPPTENDDAKEAKPMETYEELMSLLQVAEADAGNLAQVRQEGADKDDAVAAGVEGSGDGTM